MIRVDADYSSLNSVLTQIQTNDIDSIKTEIRRATLKIERDSKENIRRNGTYKTGDLRDSIFSDINSTTGSVETRLHYAIYVEKGTRPHIIRPKNKKTLRFKSGDGFAFSKEVRHPGTKAKPFLKPAFDSNKQEFLNRLRNITERGRA